MKQINLLKTLFLLTVMLVGGVNVSWGQTEYCLLDHSTKQLTGQFVCCNNISDDSKTFADHTFACYVVTTGNMSSWSCGNAEAKTIDYDIKTTSTTFTIYVGNTSSDIPQLYYVVYDESTSAHSSPDVAQTAIGDAIPKGNSTAQYTTRSVTITRSKNARVCFYTNKASNTKIYQIIANETGTALPQPGEAGYKLNMNKGRFALNSSKSCKIDNNIEIKAYNSYTMANGAYIQLDKNRTSSVYIKFTTPSNPGDLKLTWSGGQMAYNTAASATGATSITSGTAYSLAGNTTYYLVNTGSATSSITYLEFVTPTPSTPTLSVSPTSAEAFSYVVDNGPSAARTFTVTGSNLSTTITATLSNTSAYEMRTGSNNYSAGPLEGLASGTSVDVRLKAGLSTGEYDGSLTFSSTGADNKVVALSGSVTAPTYTITYAAGGGSGEMTATTSITSGSNQAITVNAFTRDCYSFAGWVANVDVTISDATVTAGTIIADGATIQNITGNITLTAQWTPAYASGTYTFENNATVGTSPSKTVTTSEETYDPFQIDNLFFSQMKIQYESGTAGLTNYVGWKIKTSGATIKFMVDEDKDITISLGTIGSGSGAKISYTAQDGTEQSNVALTAQSDNSYTIKSGTMVTITTTAAGTVTLKKIAIAKASTAPLFVGASSSPAASATGVAVSGSGYLKFNKALSSVTAANITINPNSNGEALSSIAIDGEDASKVNFSWNNLVKGTQYTISIAADAVSDGTDGNVAASLSFTTVEKTNLTGEWSTTSNTVYQNEVVAIPTFNVTAVDNAAITLGTDYSVSYELKSGSTSGIITVDVTNGITAINTSTAGTATVVATLAAVSSDYKVETATYEYTVTVNARTNTATTNVEGGSYSVILTNDSFNEVLGSSALGAETPLTYSNGPILTLSEGSNNNFQKGNYVWTKNGTDSYKSFKVGTGTVTLSAGDGITITSAKVYAQYNKDSGEATLSDPNDNSVSISLPVRNDGKDIVNNASDFAVYDFTNTKTFKVSGQAIVILEIAYTSSSHMDVTIKETGYATLYSDYAVVIPSGVTAYTAKMNQAKTSIALTALSEKIPANTGVILYTETPGKYSFAATTADAFTGENDLRGVTTATNVADLGLSGYCYTLGVSTTGTEVGMRKYTGTSIRAYSCYMDVPTQNAPFLGMNLEEGTTSIQSIEWIINDNQYYDLSGRRVENPTKGIYIKNGKKVVIK